MQAATKLRSFFLALLQPIRASMTTNMHVVQTTVFLKYRPLYAFLMRHASNVATELQKAYVATARTYYETGFRRYMRSLGWIKVGIYSDSSFHLIYCVGKNHGERSRTSIGTRRSRKADRHLPRTIELCSHRGAWCFTGLHG